MSWNNDSIIIYNQSLWVLSQPISKVISKVSNEIGIALIMKFQSLFHLEGFELADSRWYHRWWRAIFSLMHRCHHIRLFGYDKNEFPFFDNSGWLIRLMGFEKVGRQLRFLSDTCKRSSLSSSFLQFLKCFFIVIHVIEGPIAPSLFSLVLMMDRRRG